MSNFVKTVKVWFKKGESITVYLVEIDKNMVTRRKPT